MPPKTHPQSDAALKLAAFLFPHTDWWLPRLLAEGKADDVRAAIKDPQEAQLFDRVLAIEPRLPPKFYTWLAKRWAPAVAARNLSALYLGGGNANERGVLGPDESASTPEFAHKILRLFDKLVAAKQIDQKDVNAYATPRDLITATLQANAVVTKAAAKAASDKAAIASTPTIFDDDRWLVVAPSNEPAACHFGRDTKWCISGREQNMFAEYYNSGVRFVVIIDKAAAKRDPYSKIAVAYVGQSDDAATARIQDEYEIYDSTDTMRTIDDVRAKVPPEVFAAINRAVGHNMLTATPEEDAAKFAMLSPKEFGERVAAYLGHIGHRNASPELVAHFVAQLRKAVAGASSAQLGGALHRLAVGRIEPSALKPDVAGILADALAARLTSWAELDKFIASARGGGYDGGTSASGYFYFNWRKLLGYPSLRHTVSDVLAATPPAELLRRWKAWRDVAYENSPDYPVAEAEIGLGVVQSSLRAYLDRQAAAAVGLATKDGRPAALPVNGWNGNDTTKRLIDGATAVFGDDSAADILARKLGRPPTDAEIFAKYWGTVFADKWEQVLGDAGFSIGDFDRGTLAAATRRLADFDTTPYRLDSFGKTK